MSVVAVKVNKNKIEFAADSIAVFGSNTKRDDFLVKLTEINQMIIGGVGEAKENNLMFIFAQTHSPFDNTERAIRDFFFEFGKWKDALNLGFESENDYLFGYKGKVFQISNLLVQEIKNYAAIGAGMDYALAALYLQHSAEEAVKVACKLSRYVCEPIIKLSMEAANE